MEGHTRERSRGSWLDAARGGSRRGRRAAVRMACLACCAVCLPAAAAVARGQAAAAANPPVAQRLAGVQAGPPALSLAAPFAPVPIEDAAQLEAAARSRTAFEGLDAQQAEAVAERTFALQHPSWVAPGSEPGRRVGAYLGNYSATEQDGHGAHVVVQSTVPLQAVDSAGRLAPVSLSLRDEGDAYAPVNAGVRVRIAKRLSAGVSFPSGIVIVPVSAQERQGPTVVGERVMYANSAHDTDFIAQALAGGIGAELSWQLRSQDSSPENALAFKLPPGGALRMSTQVPGGAEVTVDGTRRMLIAPATATQASGATLPVRYSISGDVLEAHVELSEGVQFPVLVDPEVIATDGEGGDGGWSYWEAWESCGGCFEFPINSSLVQVNGPLGPIGGNEANWEINVSSKPWVRITRVDVANLTHQPRGQSDIEAGIGNSNGHEIWTTNGFGGAQGENAFVTRSSVGPTPMAFCAQGAGGTDGGSQPLCAECKQSNGSGCTEGYGGERFYLQLYLVEPRTVTNWVSITSATVRYIQTQRPNVTLSGVKSGWNRTAGGGTLGLSVEDKGTGIRDYGIDAVYGVKNVNELPSPGSSPAPGTSVHHPGCINPFCPENASESVTLSEIGTGAWTLGPWAGDPAELKGQSAYTVYVDKTSPVIATPSWNGSTFGEGPHTLAVSAQDGNSAEPQSGVALIEMYVDGTPFQSIHSACPAP
jgi:hypothetical protein